MTSGGPVVQTRAPAVSTRRARRTPAALLADPRLIEYLPALLAAGVFLGCFMRIRQRWFIPGFPGAGYTTWVTQTTIDGTAIAPNQYRVLMPWLDHTLAETLRVPLPTGILSSDLTLLTITFVLLMRIAARLGAPGLVLGAAAVWAWWVAKLDHWHPEIMALTMIVTATTLLLLAPQPRYSLRRCSGLLVLGLLACGARADYAATIGAVVSLVGLHRRQWPLAATGVLIGVGCAASTLALEHFYPLAHYATAVVQLPYNLSLGSWGTVVPFYGVVVATPVLLAVRRCTLPPLAFVPVMFGVEFMMVFVVGRVDESRIFMPLAPVLGIAAVLAWHELHREAAERSTTGRRGDTPSQ